MKRKNLILLVGIAAVLVGLLTLVRGTLFDIPANPYHSQRIDSPGIIILIVGVLILYFGIKNRKSI